MTFFIQKQTMDFQTCSRYPERSAFVMITNYGQRRMSSFLSSAPCSPTRYPHLKTPLSIIKRRVPIQWEGTKYMYIHKHCHVRFPVLILHLTPQLKASLTTSFHGSGPYLSFILNRSKPEMYSCIPGGHNAHQKTML